jgi:hypothetical protein
MPVVGYLNIGSTTMEDARMVSFQEGLREQGFVEGRNAVIESRYASTGDYEGLLALANDLVRLPVTVLFATGSAGVASTLADLQEQVSALTRELAEAREQQTATSEVLSRHLKLARRVGAGFPGYAGERGLHLRGRVRHPVSSGGRRLPSRCSTQRAACIRRVLATRTTSAGSEHSP